MYHCQPSYFRDRNWHTDDILFPFLKKLLVVDHFYFFGNSKNISKPYTYCKYIYINNNLIVKGYVTSNSPPRYWSMNLLLGLAPSWNMIMNLNQNVDLFNNNGDFLNQMLSSKHLFSNFPLSNWHPVHLFHRSLQLPTSSTVTFLLISITVLIYIFNSNVDFC